MRKNPRLFRLAATVALAGLLSDALLPLAATAQPAPPPLPTPGLGRPDLNQAQGDPPARVGRVANIAGIVSFHNLGDTQWSVASTNYPVSSGNAFWTESSASARLEVSDSRIVMAGGTEFNVATLDAAGLQGVAAQGELYMRLRDLAPNEVWSIQTPRGLVHLAGAGRYAILVGTTDQPTLVTVLEGAASVEGPGVSLQIAANQTATISGPDPFQGSVGPALRDAFLTASLNAERPPPAPAASIPTQTVYAMPGGSDLVNTGSWNQAPQYGEVWYPPVAASWVPYREGHWAYVEPWGWTWIDDASWGFAPFHYGRWVQIEGRWAWTPGEIAVHERPVYAPALVTFIGIGAGVALGAALVAGSVGWVPLGPREQYHPWYHASNNYIQQVNVSHVTNITNNVTTNNYINRSAATSIPAAAMTASRPVQAVAQPITAQQFAAARPITGQQPIRPTAATAGVTPVVARQLNLASTGATAHPAPGPVVRPAAAGTKGFARPTFAPAQHIQAPAAAVPNQPTAAGPGRVGSPTPESGHPASTVPPATTPHPEPAHVAAEGVRPSASGPEAARPANAPAPQAAHPATAVQPTSRPMQPAPFRPPAAPTAPHPVPPVATRSEPATPHPQPATSHPEAIVRPAPQPAQRPAPEVARVMPRPEPPHVAPIIPHAEARAPEPARPAPQERKKAPDER